MKRLVYFIAFIFSTQLAFAQCFPDRHNTSWNSAWISCEQRENPNPLRGNSHWIRYNTNNIYSFGKITYWNFNDPARLDNGLNEIIIDYSLDGIEWQEFGSFVLERAEGSSFYEGTEGPDLAGLEAKDILVTAVSNHGGDCYALSEIKIEILDLVSSDEDLVLDVQLKLSPVPTRDRLKVVIDSETVNGRLAFKLVDLQGKEFLNGSIFKSSNQHEQTLDVSSLPSGQYLLDLVSENGSASKKFTIIR